MTVPVVTFFSTKGGVGKTSLIYHTAWMLAELGYRVVIADLDPQCNLSASCLTDDRFFELSQHSENSLTIYGALTELAAGHDDPQLPWLEPLASNLTLIPGDLSLVELETEMSQAWYRCAAGDRGALSLVSDFGRVLQKGASQFDADLVLMDLAPNFGAVNRAALIAADALAIPILPDQFSIRALESVGSGLRSLHQAWGECLGRNDHSDFDPPSGRMRPLGYVMMNRPAFQGRMPNSLQAWAARIPGAYRRSILGCSDSMEVGIDVDENCLAVIKYYHSLVSMAQEARKPMFDLKPADGALGAFSTATHDVYKDFKRLAETLIERAGVVKRF